MANVREAFPECERLRRVKRGHLPRKVWNKAPTLDQVIGKMATVLDSQIKNVAVANRPPHELRRYVFRSGNRFGYLCFKTANTHFERCQSVADLQKAYDALEQTINWSTSLGRLQEYVAAHCTSPAYVERVRRIRI